MFRIDPYQVWVPFSSLPLAWICVGYLCNWVSTCNCLSLYLCVTKPPAHLSLVYGQVSMCVCSCINGCLYMQVCASGNVCICISMCVYQPVCIIVCVLHLCTSLCFSVCVYMCLDVRLSSCTWVFSDVDVCCIWVCVFAVCVCVSGCASVNWCTWGCVNLFVSQCVCVGPCVDGRGRGSLRVHMQLFPSVSFMCRELCPHIFTPPPASRSPECGCFPLSLPLGTGPDLLSRTGEVGVCKHVEGPTQQPLHKALSAGRPGWSFCFGGENWTPLLGDQWALWI